MSMFQIVCVEGAGNVVPFIENGEIVTFPDGKAAQAACQILSAQHGKKFQPRRANLDKNWRKREALRFADGTYKKVPWADEKWFVESKVAQDHFLHLSKRHPGKVAFTEDETKGGSDLQSPLRAGRYLSRFFGDVLTKQQIQHYVTQFSVLYENGVLLFADSSDEIEEVYTANGSPRSCMGTTQHRRNEGWGQTFKGSANGLWDSPFHPVRVYGAGDLAVAYFKTEGVISGRALVWPEKKTFSRIYGDVYRMNGMLDMAGYRHANPIGARLLRHVVDEAGEDDSGYRGTYYVAPYIDKGPKSGEGHLSVYPNEADNQKTLIIVDAGEGVPCGSLNGCSAKIERYSGYRPFPRIACDDCGERVREDMTVLMNDTDERLCEDCYGLHGFSCGVDGMHYDKRCTERIMISGGYVAADNLKSDHVFTSDLSGRMFFSYDKVVLGNGQKWSSDEAATHARKCGYDGKYYPLSSTKWINVQHESSWWRQEAFEQHGFRCPYDGLNYNKKYLDNYTGLFVHNADRVRERADMDNMQWRPAPVIADLFVADPEKKKKKIATKRRRTRASA
jgi:hypothetical protein